MPCDAYADGLLFSQLSLGLFDGVLAAMRQTGVSLSHEEIVWTVAAGVCDTVCVCQCMSRFCGFVVSMGSESVVAVRVGCTAGLYDYLLARRPLLQPATGLQIVPDRQVVWMGMAGFRNRLHFGTQCRIQIIV
jgi:hypothetical protein